MQPSSSASRSLAIHVLHHALTTSTAPEFIRLTQFGGPAPNDADSRFIRSMVLSALRHLGQIDALLASYIEKPLPASKAWVQCALRIGICQMRFHDVPAHAAVNSTVEAVKQSKYKALCGMANAVLKRAAYDTSPLAAPASNLPDWLRQRLIAQYGDACVNAVAAVAEQQPATDIFGATPDNNFPAQALNAYTMRCENIEALHGYLHTQTTCFVQDIAASYPVHMLGNISGKTVIEIGAAPGGKTMQMLMAGAQVTALDRSEKRMRRLQENLAARGLNTPCIVTDALKYTPDSTPDIVVLDAPCTATGTWRKHPEVVHLLRENDIHDLARVQAQLMDKAWSWLVSGGVLAYSVCSLQKEEGEDQLTAFLSRHPDTRIHAPDTTHLHALCVQRDGSVRTHPAMMAGHGGMDGFFAVLLKKM